MAELQTLPEDSNFNDIFKILVRTLITFMLPSFVTEFYMAIGQTQIGSSKILPLILLISDATMGQKAVSPFTETCIL